MRTFRTSFLTMVVWMTMSYSPAASGDAPINLGANIASQSPDTSLVELNGAIVATGDNHIIGWTYDWGDGQTTEGFFPAFHRYQQPGVYTVRVTGCDDRSNVKVVTLDCTVTGNPPSAVREVTLSPTALGLKPGESANVQIGALDAEGKPVEITSRLKEIYVPTIYRNFVTASIVSGGLRVEASDLKQQDAALAVVQVYVDKVGCKRPLYVIVNKNPSAYQLVETQHTALYLPNSFFSKGNVAPDEQGKVLEQAFLYNRSCVQGTQFSGLPANELQAVSYAPRAYGWNGNPLALGDGAQPLKGVPKFAVMFHEMGHNFSCTHMFFASVGIPGPFYQETLAEWFKQSDIESILRNHRRELTDTAVADLEDIRRKSRMFHEREYRKYVDAGMKFDYDNISASQVVVQRIYEHCDAAGWDVLEKFMECYRASLLSAYSRVLGSHGGLTTENKVTLMAATLTTAFGKDFRGDLRELNFPIKDSFYDAVVSLLQEASSR